MNSRFLLIVVACILILGGVFFITKDKADVPSGSGNPSNHVTGNTDSSVTLIEYGDLECNACAAYFPIVNKIKEDYKDKIVFQFRHFPLVQIHPNAMVAARAAEAAGQQGKFWEMHDLLYSQQSSWSKSDNATAIFEDYAAQLGLNVEDFKTYAASQAAIDTINADVREGQKLDINATPTFVLNGEKVQPTPQTYEAFAKLLDEKLAQ